MGLEQIVIEVRNHSTGDVKSIYINVFDNALSQTWYTALKNIVSNNLHLEKNYCWLGWPETQRNGWMILHQLNNSIDAINKANLGYTINDHFTMENCIADNIDDDLPLPRSLIHDRTNLLHRYFEDLQGSSGAMSKYWQLADPHTRWHIRQLNLLCHEFECWALSWRKQLVAPEWIRPSTLMCWLNAPRFAILDEHLDSFGIHAIDRTFGGVYVGVNKAIGKTHWEVFNDEGPNSVIDQTMTTGLRCQVEAAGDFDIEWGRNCGGQPWQVEKIHQFTEWLKRNGLDPHDPTLTLGHPQVAQIDLYRSFGSDNYCDIWQRLQNYLDVYSITVDGIKTVYDYHWSDDDYQTRQVACLGRNV